MSEQKKGLLVETVRQARCAEPGPTVRNVLVWSAVLVVIAFVGVYLAFAKWQPRPEAERHPSFDR